MAMSVALIAACGSAHAPTRAPDGARSLSHREVVDAEAMISDIDTKLRGTAEELSAGEYEARYVLHHGIEQCMHEHGFDYDWPYADRYANYDVGPTSMGGVTKWLDRLNISYVSTLELHDNAWRHDWHEGELATDRFAQEHPGFVQQLGECDDYLGPQVEAYPTAHVDVVFAYQDLLESIDGSVPDTLATEYGACMKERGLDVSSYADLIDLLKNQVPSADHIPLPGEPADKVWQGFVASESTAMDADAQCRAAAHEAALEIAIPKVRAFADERAEDISAMQSDWQALMSLAAKHGWQAHQG
jgi:hypothetical protein